MTKFTFHVSVLVLCLAMIVTMSIADDSSILNEKDSKETENAKSIEDKDLIAREVGTLADSNKSPSIDKGVSLEAERSKSVVSEDAAAKGKENLQDSQKQESPADEASVEIKRSKQVESEDEPAKSKGNLQDSKKQGLLADEPSVEIDRSKSVENQDKASQVIEKDTDSKKIALATSGAAREVVNSKSVENADAPAKEAGDLAAANKLATLIYGADNKREQSESVDDLDGLTKGTKILIASDETERFKSGSNVSVLTQVKEDSEKKLPHEGATDDRSQQIKKSSATLHAISSNLTDTIKLKTAENQTLLTLTLDNGNTEHLGGSYPKKDFHDKNGSRIDDVKIKASLRHPILNATDDKNFWNKWSSSNQLVPRTGLLASGAVVCILVRLVIGGLGFD